MDNDAGGVGIGILTRFEISVVSRHNGIVDQVALDHGAIGDFDAVVLTVLESAGDIGINNQVALNVIIDDKANLRQGFHPLGRAYRVHRNAERDEGYAGENDRKLLLTSHM